MRVAELEGALLDYWVARAEILAGEAFHGLKIVRNICWHVQVHCGAEIGESGDVDVGFCPSTDWEDGGPIIEREQIAPYHRDEDGSDNVWHAVCPMPKGYEATEDGPTLLIAAMRAYVASKYGDEVEDL